MSRALLSSVTAVSAVTAVTVSLSPVAAIAEGPRARHVVLIDWDGIDPSYLRRASMPHLDALRKRGSLSFATGTYRAISNPNRASLATGAFPSTHHNSAYVYDPVSNVITGQNRTIDAENIAESLTRQGRTIASAGWYIVENKGAYYGDPARLYTQESSCEGNSENAARIIRRQPVRSGNTLVTVPEVPAFLAVYCSEADTLGHAEGPRSPRLPALLERFDTYLGGIVQATRDAGTFGDTAFVVTSDHGMTAFSKTMHDRLLARLASAGFRAEIVFRGQSPRPETEVILAENERAAAVHLRGSATGRRGELRRLFARTRQIARVHDRADLRRLHAAPSEGDFVLEARRPWSFVPPSAMPPAGTEKGAHATLAEMRVPLVIAGSGVPLRAPFAPRTIDVIPTISALLGAEPPAQADGRELWRRPIQGTNLPTSAP
ncbi:alkaline phosphatase family protein [Actinomadura sp. 6N118]|uniref:alkaline phosphatase family protein n=1 Tax=Actinomadura sp. 6N118 TaxID=3375151 RepID=UPI0037BC2C9F